MTEKELITKRNADAMLAPLRQFFHQHGHAHVPKLADYANVFDLCSRLRGIKAILPPKICKELDKMGFIWRINLSNDLKWYYNFGELKSFYKQHGHTRVPLRKPPYNSLGSWVLRQRRDEKRLSKEHKRMLTGIGFEWSDDIRQKKDKEWKQMFDKLFKFYKRNGHSNVPDRYRPDEKLGRWVSTVRYAQGRLEPWKSKLLRTVGFKSSDDIRKMREDNRTLLFKKIERYFTKYGHANVPESYVDSKLAIAIAYLRQYPTRISDAERKKLKQWNFLFSDQIKLKWEKLWDHSYDKLTKFKQRFGHCRVSSAYKDQQLARWVANQRKDEQEGRLPKTRKKRLSSIGFSFYKDIADMHENTWLAMYNKLLKFKKKFGTTVVKEGYRDSKLAYWVQHQRQARNKMKDSRKILLDKIHFTWSLR